MKDMTSLAAAALALALETGVANAQQTISPASERPASIGPSDYFTGQVVVEPIFGSSTYRNVSAAKVTFQPNARSAWHTHPTGQTLIVVSGTGWTGTEDGGKQVINAGDVLWCPPGLRHWHGGTDSTAMSHIAVTGVEGETAVNWMEHVTDEQFLSD